MAETPKRFIGLDIHRDYLVAVGVEAGGNVVLKPCRVRWTEFDRWAGTALSPDDAVVFEMTFNALGVHDQLCCLVRSVTVVHPPHVRLITRTRVQTDEKAALTLARLHAAGLLTPVWVPPADVRDQRALVAQRARMTRLMVQAKNRLHAVLHRLRCPLPDQPLFEPAQRPWWLSLQVSSAQRVRIECDLDTLAFAQQQVERFTTALIALAGQDERVPLLIQLPGVSVIVAVTILAAIGSIERFPSPKRLAGYAGLGVTVHDSGQTHITGRITKEGRRELRTALVEAAHVAARYHPYWKAQRVRLERRIGYEKAIVAIARRLLVAVWHVLTYGVADRFSDCERVARKLTAYAYRLGRRNRPAGQSVAEYVRVQLDHLQLDCDLTEIARHGRHGLKWPPPPLPSGTP